MSLKKLTIRRYIASALITNSLTAAIVFLICSELYFGLMMTGLTGLMNVLLYCSFRFKNRQDYIFWPVFVSFGINAVMFAGISAGILMIMIPVVSYMSGIVIPDPEKQKKKKKILVIALYTVGLYAIRLTRLGSFMQDNLVIADIIVYVSSLLQSLFITNIINFREDSLKNEVKKAETVSETDALTGLYNRKNLEMFLHEQMKKIDAFSVIMLDIDHFKSVNDTYGHAEGDRILQDLASTMKCHIRSEDRAFRYGGEEFCIVCPHTKSSGAYNLAERIRTGFRSKTYVYDMPDPTLRLKNYTVSLGITEYIYTPGLKAEDLVKQADAALYRAKNNGRNQTRFYEEIAKGDNGIE